MRHKWRDRYFNPFGRDYLMECEKCGMQAKRSQARRGVGPCNPSTHAKK